MIESSRKFKEYFRMLYETIPPRERMEKGFEDVFFCNKSRMEYLNGLLEESGKYCFYGDEKHVFEGTIKYLVSFINGKEKGSNKIIPREYYEDQGIGAIIPSMDELSFLLKLIETDKILFETTYKDNPLYLKLPDRSFNQNMVRILEIKKKNIAHLLGLTEYEDINNPDPNKNLLKKHFNSVVKDKSIYAGSTESEKLLEWIVSEEGKKELFRIHKITQDFMQKDMIQNPKSYEDGRLKSDSSVVSKFKVRYKNYTGLDYPIINFSRLMVKSLNSYNFLRLNNIVEVILDFNAPKGMSNEKDIFLVNRNAKKILDDNKKFVSYWSDVIVDFYKYAYDENNEELKRKLINSGINVNSSIIKDQLNIIKARDFLGTYGINPDDSVIDDKVIEFISYMFDKNINLIGFNTEFGKDKEIPLYNYAEHHAHCDTSISLTVAELVGLYYKNGRSFFLDKIESDKGILMVSNVNDEIHYLKRVMDIQDDAYYKMEELIELKQKLNNNYKEYLYNSAQRR